MSPITSNEVKNKGSALRAVALGFPGSVPGFHGPCGHLPGFPKWGCPIFDHHSPMNPLCHMVAAPILEPILVLGLNRMLAGLFCFNHMALWEGLLRAGRFGALQGRFGPRTSRCEVRRRLGGAAGLLQALGGAELRLRAPHLPGAGRRAAGVKRDTAGGGGTRCFRCICPARWVFLRKAVCFCVFVFPGQFCGDVVWSKG